MDRKRKLVDLFPAFFPFKLSTPAVVIDQTWCVGHKKNITKTVQLCSRWAIVLSKENSFLHIHKFFIQPMMFYVFSLLGLLVHSHLHTLLYSSQCSFCVEVSVTHLAALKLKVLFHVPLSNWTCQLGGCSCPARVGAARTAALHFLGFNP